AAAHLEHSTANTRRVARTDAAAVAVANATTTRLANARAISGSVRRHTQHAGQRANLPLLINLPLRWNHHGLLNRELGRIVTNHYGWRRNLLHAELWRNAFAGFQLVAIATATTTTDPLRRGREWNVRADLDY